VAAVWLFARENTGILFFRGDSLMSLKNGVTYGAGGFGKTGFVLAEK